MTLGVFCRVNICVYSLELTSPKCAGNYRNMNMAIITLFIKLPGWFLTSPEMTISSY